MSEHPLRLWRKDHSVTQEAVAAAVGLHASHISQLENGLKSVSLEKATLIERFTNGAVPAGVLVPVAEAPQ